MNMTVNILYEMFWFSYTHKNETLKLPTIRIIIIIVPFLYTHKNKTLKLPAIKK